MGALGPDQDRLDWFTVVIGDFTLPPISEGPLAGSIVLKCTSEQKLDSKKAAGKNKAKSTQQGVETVKGTIEFEFPAAAWPDGEMGLGVESTLTAIDPNGPSKGGPFGISHPDTNWRSCTNVMITKIEAVEWKGWKGSTKIEFEEWNPDTSKNAGDGGTATTTPDKSEQEDPAGDKNGTGTTQPRPVPAQADPASQYDPKNTPSGPTPNPMPKL